ncbi:unnamed protein product [Mytilus coruscus]|uniref:Uncharacterized protein n=1 Tax=Mytilus coruscus TaxID=42192 RepID=A0A6J8E5K4_MYTCO|nr:unnamed protein product [Mytilus coruscus]
MLLLDLFTGDSQYSKGTEWSENMTTHSVATSIQMSKSTHSSSIGSPDVRQNGNIEKKGSKTLSSNIIIYFLCTGSLAVIIGLSILFRQYCYRQKNALCWKIKNSVQIANHRNSAYNDEFRDDFFELERNGSIYDIIDENNMIENIEHLQDEMHINQDVKYEYAFA